MKVHEGMPGDAVLRDFGPGWAEMYAQGFTLRDWAHNQCGIRQLLAASGVFWPTITESDGYVLLWQENRLDRLARQIEMLREKFGGNLSAAERYHNAKALWELFTDDPENLGITWEQMDNLVFALGDVLKMFWSLRLQTLFPDHRFAVELGIGLKGEYGLAITFYEIRETQPLNVP